MKLHICAHLRAKREVFSIILTSFRQEGGGGGGKPPTPPTKKHPKKAHSC